MVSESELADLCDENGFLSDTGSWSDDIAQAFAMQEGISLTNAHWEVLFLLRDYFAAFGDSPANRALVNFTKQQLGPEKGKASISWGYSPLAGARRQPHCGLPKPKNCLLATVQHLDYQPERCESLFQKRPRRHWNDLNHSRRPLRNTTHPSQAAIASGPSSESGTTAMTCTT